MDKQNLCQVCGSDQWVNLPDPTPNQSVTTAGRIVPQPLGKSQCLVCGFVQRIRVPFLGFTKYYEQDYANYYERPGTEKYHLNRYMVMIDWMNTYIHAQHKIENVLDVGCGQGWAMNVLKNIYPTINIEGIEPSEYNVKKARQKELFVYEGKLEDVALKKNHYDLVFSNNVIQHVNNAGSFMSDLKKLIKEDGVIIITCPNGALPNIEILWADQNFSFLPQHLIAIAKKVGFNHIYWAESPLNSALPPAQLLMLTNNPQYSEFDLKNISNSSQVDPQKILANRIHYIENFSHLNIYLSDQIQNSSLLCNFGASYWTSVLAAYCPAYWENVKYNILDEASDVKSFLGKQLIQANQLNKDERDTLVLGIAPSSQKKVKERLKNDWNKIIVWDKFIKY